MNNQQNRDFEDIETDKYDTRYIVNLLSQKYPHGKAFFHFNNMSDYITFSHNGQINARSREEGLFKVWQKSEFKDLKPRTVFLKLEEKIAEIRVAFADGKGRSFSSYNDFVDWLTFRQELN